MTGKRTDQSAGSSSPRFSTSGAPAVVAAVGLAIVAQKLLQALDQPWAGVGAYAAASGIFLWGLNRWSAGEGWAPPDWTHGREAGPNGNPLLRGGLALLALALAVAAYRGFADNRLSAVGVAAWLGALTAFLLAAAEGPVPSRLARRLRDRALAVRQTLKEGCLHLRVSRTALILAAIVLVGVFFRTYRLSAVPPEMTSDHAEKLLDVHDVLNGARRIFFPRNTGREAIQFYLTAVLIRLTPLTISHLALKVGTALVSIATVPLAFLLGRSIYGRRIGLLAAGLVALSRWHVAISRVGLRFPFTPLFTVLVMTFLFRAFRHNRRNDWLACGLALGAGLHSYTAVRILPLLLVVLTLAKAGFDLVERRRGARNALGRHGGYSERTALSGRFWINAVLGALASLLVFLPLLRYMREHPDMFWYRVRTRVAEAEHTLPAQPVRVFVVNVKDALLMFNYEGGPVWVNTVPEDPVLSVVVGALFVLGVAFALWRLLRQGDRRALYLLLSLFVLILPSALSVTFPVENPSVVRAGGAIPVAALLAALAMGAMNRALRVLFRGGRRWLAVVPPAALLIAAAYLTFNWYFIIYDHQYRRSVWGTRDIGRVVRGFANSVGDLDHAYHIPYPHWVDTRNIAINAGDITWRNAVRDLGELRAHMEDPAPKLYILYPGDQDALRILQDLYPQGQLRRYRAEVAINDFFIFFVP